MVTRSGTTPVTVLGKWKNALAAARSRCSLSITSVGPMQNLSTQVTLDCCGIAIMAIDQRTIAIDSAIKVALLTMDFDVCFVVYLTDIFDKRFLRALLLFCSAGDAAFLPRPERCDGAARSARQGWPKATARAARP